jgi:hypothetical protein
MVQLLQDSIAAGERPGLIVYDEDADAFIDPGLSQRVMISHNLFASFRDLDAAGVTRIVARTIDPVTTLVRQPPIPGGIGLARAIDDRLIRAAGSRVHLTEAAKRI